jgi:hypothetical protein
MVCLRRRARLWKWLAGLLAAASFILVFACNSPFIPIPPPDPTFNESATTPGQWSVSSGPDSRASSARFYIYNASTGSGLIQRAAPDGSMYAYPLYGKAGDSIEIHWERTVVDSSSTICRPLGPGLVQQGCQ